MVSRNSFCASHTISLYHHNKLSITILFSPSNILHVRDSVTVNLNYFPQKSHREKTAGLLIRCR